MTVQTLPSVAERLNQSCFCITLDREKLHAAMEREAGDPDFSSRYIRPREHLFSNVPVFLDARDLDRMTAVVHAIEAAARLPGLSGDRAGLGAWRSPASTPVRAASSWATTSTSAPTGRS